MQWNYTEWLAQGNKPLSFGQSPLLEDETKKGILPPLLQRLPQNPLVLEPWESTGRYGGTVRYGEINPKFCHYMRHLNEAALLEVGESNRFHHYSRMEGPVLPGVLETYETSRDGTRHEFSIRKGLRWSDGTLVSTEDVRYTVEDVLLHPSIRPFLTNSETSAIMLPEWEWLFWGEKPVQVECLDEQRFCLVFSRPYHAFVRQQVRSARYHMLLRPSHYLKKYHSGYADAVKLGDAMKKAGFAVEQWGAYYNALDPSVREAGYFLPGRIPQISQYPTLDPWLYDSDEDSKVLRLTRNPYYYAVDTHGNQLPYLDHIERVYLSGGQKELERTVMSGGMDISGCFLNINKAQDYNKAAQLHDCNLLLLRPWQVQQAVILINLCPEQKELRHVVQDVRFRRALSLCLDRETIRMKVFGGRGVISQLTAGRDKSYYDPSFAKSYSGYDPETSCALLDEMGLYWDEHRQVRLLPDGSPLEMELVYYLVTPVADELAPLLAQYFGAVGIKLKIIRLEHGSQMGYYQAANRHIFSIWEMAGDDPLIPYQAGGLSDPVPLWWKWYETRGVQGEMPTVPGRRLYMLRDALKTACTDETCEQIAREIYQLQAENLWILGLAAEVPQPFIHKKALGNLACAQARGYFLSTVLSGARQWFWKNPQKKL